MSRTTIDPRPATAAQRSGNAPPAGADQPGPHLHATEVVLPAAGPPDVLQVRTRELPSPGPGQQVVRVEATGVSFAEQQMRLGKYYDQPPFPFVPGYDLVGIVETGRLTGRRVAALTKTGAWADRVVLDEADLVEVPAGVSAVDAEAAIVNGVTAHRMLHEAARVQHGQTAVVLGAAGGVGTVLVQLAREAGVRVIGTARPNQAARVEALGAAFVDRHDDVPARVAALAPDGVDAVFDHVGGPGLRDSWRMLARGGTLVSYGTASTKDTPGSSRWPVLELVVRLLAWQVLPNGRRATFFNLWAGHRRRNSFRRRLRRDLAAVLDAVRRGELTPEIAATFPLTDAAAALRFAESGGHVGKVVLTTSMPAPTPTSSTTA